MERDYTINRLIKDKINESGVKQSVVADKAGIRRDTFSRIVNCKRPIFGDELVPIINAAGISLEQVAAAVGGA